MYFERVIYSLYQKVTLNLLREILGYLSCKLCAWYYENISYVIMVRGKHLQTL